MPPLNTLLTTLHVFCDMIIIGKESTIAFSTIDKLVVYFKIKRKLKKSDSTSVLSES